MIQKKDFVKAGVSRTFEDTGGSGRPIIEHQCTECGSTVYSELKVLKDIIAVPASTLENPSLFTPETHVWISSRNHHFEISDNLPQEQGPPKSMLQYLF